MRLQKLDLVEESPEIRRAREEGYRRGYRDGWVQGLDAFADRLGATFKGKVYRAYLRLWGFGMTGALYSWHRNLSKAFNPPPRP